MVRKIVLAVVALAFLAVAGVVGVFVLKHVRRAVRQASPPHSREYRKPGKIVAVETIYDAKFGEGWQDWGWGRHELVPGQPARIAFGSYGGIIVHHDTLPSRYGGVSFRYQAPESFGDFLEVSLMYQQLDESTFPHVFLEPRHVAKLPDGWFEVLVPWTELNPKASRFDRIQIHAARPVEDDLVAIDRFVLTEALPEDARAVASRPVKVSVACGAQAQKISPLVYGIASDDWTTGAGARRIGGNVMSRLNWDLDDTWNTGNDWYFENVAGKTGLTTWLAESVKHQVPTTLVVPMIGWVAKDRTSVGFPTTQFGPQQAQDPYRSEAGNGVRKDGSKLTPGSPTQTSIAAPPELIEKWIRRLVERDRAAGKRSVETYILDNEPTLWNTTHRDVHPDPLTYDELLDRTVKYASVIRAADPEANIAGPAEWGWSAFFYSAKDLAVGASLHPDRLMHGGTPLLPWYLKQLAEHERKTGVRLLDVVDVHWYPQANGVWGGNAATDRETSALRLRATRSLWDPTYVDESWIDERVQLIPRLKEWIAENYPGRAISLGEWNFGAEDHVSGGLAVAEVLGRLGQQGVRSAYYWMTPAPGTPAHMAFRAFRNYDGKGARFGDWSLPTEGAEDVSVFAARDESGGRVTLVILNLDADAPVVAEVDASRCGSSLAHRSFSMKDGSKDLEPGPVGTSTGKVVANLPPWSLTVLELTTSKPAAP